MNDFMQKSNSYFKSWWYVLAGVALVVLGVVIGRVMSAGKSEISAGSTQSVSAVPAEPAVVMAVEAVRPTVLNVSGSMSANGVISAKQTAQVSGHLTGVALEAVLVDVGDVVKKGQVLALLDDSLLSDALVQAGADVAQAQANYAKARVDVQRVEPLLSIDAISKQEMDAYQTVLEQAKASLSASQARLKSAQTNLKNTQIVAPVSGIVSQKNAQVGLLVGGTPLFEIIVDGQLEWQATLNPAQAKSISVGQRAELIVGNVRVMGKFSHLSPVANNAREVVAHVVLPTGVPLKAGMYQTGQFLFDSQPLPAVPISALMSSDGYDYVWTLHAKAGDTYSVKRTKVQTGKRQGDKVVVDLPSDSLLVRQSGSFLSEGDVVRVVSIQQQEH